MHGRRSDGRRSDVRKNCADLCRAYLCRADLCRADLSRTTPRRSSADRFVNCRDDGRDDQRYADRFLKTQAFLVRLRLLEPGEVERSVDFGVPIVSLVVVMTDETISDTPIAF